LALTDTAKAYRKAGKDYKEYKEKRPMNIRAFMTKCESSMLTDGKNSKDFKFPHFRDGNFFSYIVVDMVTSEIFICKAAHTGHSGI
jgi:hypothetical protein